MTESVQYRTISEAEAGQRLDNFLMRILKGVPRSHLYRIIRKGEIRINKKRVKPLDKLQVGDILRIPPIRTSAPTTVHVSEGLAQHLEDCIIYEDNALIVINKPAGIAVHGGSGLSLGIIEALRKMKPTLTELELVHRLDKDTSGCLLLAKKRSMLRALHQLLEKKLMQKTYYAILANPWVGPKKRVVNVPLEKITGRGGERIVSVQSSGKASETHFTLLENFSNACLVKAEPKTGRTHQIRVHAQYLQHPILGDNKYNPEPLPSHLMPRLYLHAQQIQFTLDDKPYAFQAELDNPFNSTLEKLRMAPGR
ncbi:MAG: RluA family pseudouridine synthase [Legionellaceae bacterium]|nr:RluA family pseudouridine synthase [Legionellaceae bacterium]